MTKRLKLSKYIVILFILASITGLVGFILLAKSTQVKTVRIKYNETAKLKYKVHITDTADYETEYLDEGMQYITNMIDKIYIDYYYNITYNKKINVPFNNEVTADIKIVDETNNKKIIYEKNEKLKSNKSTKTNVNSLTENQTIVIDYAKYNKKVTDFKKQHNIVADCKLIVTFKTYQGKDTNYLDSIEKYKEMAVVIPLSKKMINITKSADSNKRSSYVASQSVPLSNVVMSITAITLFILTGLFILTALYFIYLRSKITSQYDKFIEKILKQYDAYITESEGIIKLKEDVIMVKSFKELLDVRNNVEKAIVYNRISPDCTNFIVIDGEQEYCYTVKKEDV